MNNRFSSAVTDCSRCGRRLGIPCYIVANGTLAEDRALIGLTVCEICKTDLDVPDRGIHVVRNNCLCGFITFVNARTRAPPAQGPLE